VALGAAHEVRIRVRSRMFVIGNQDFGIWKLGAWVLTLLGFKGWRFGAQCMHLKSSALGPSASIHSLVFLGLVPAFFMRS
jgi:hypothetical protein